MALNPTAPAISTDPHYRILASIKGVPSQRGDINQRMRLVCRRGVIQRICHAEPPQYPGEGRADSTCVLTRKNQPPLRIRIINLHRLPVHRIYAARNNQQPYVERPCWFRLQMEDRWTYISPGLFALGPGMFSQSGVIQTRLILH